MKTFGKTLGLIILGLVVIVAIIAFALTRLIDPNDHKEQIRQLVREQAHLDLQLGGDIHWQLLPRPAIEVEQASLAPEGKPNQTIAYVQQVDLSVRLLPLLHRQLRVSDLHLHGLELRLSRDANGLGNWQTLLPTDNDTNSQASEPKIQAKAEAASAAPAGQAPRQPGKHNNGFRIDSLTLDDGQIQYSDALHKQSWVLDHVELHTGTIRPGHKIPISINSHLRQAKSTLSGEIGLDARLRFDPDQQRFQMDIKDLNGQLKGRLHNNRPVTFNAAAQLLVDRIAQVADVNNLKLQINDLSLTSNLHIYDLDSNPQLEGKLAMARFNLRQFLTKLGHPLSNSSAKDAYTGVKLSSDISANAQTLQLNNLRLDLDDSHFGGQITITGLDQQPNTKINLGGDHLNLDRYLAHAVASQKAPADLPAAGQPLAKAKGAPQAQDQASAQPKQATDDDSQPILPVDTLKKLAGHWQLDVGKLTVQGVEVNHGHIEGSAAHGRIHLDTLQGALGDGNFKLSGELDLNSKQPRLAGKLTTRALPLEPFLQHSSAANTLRGNLDLNADLNTTGNSRKQWTENLNGKVHLMVNDGALLGANLERSMCEGLAFLNKKPLDNPPQGKKTPFHQLSGSIQFNRGKGHSRDLQIAMAGLKVDGEGDLNLPTQSMDYHLGLLIQGDQRANADAACRVNERYAKLHIPLRCQGPLDGGVRNCGLDKDQLGHLVTGALTERLEDKLNKFEDKVPKKYMDAIKGLFH